MRNQLRREGDYGGFRKGRCQLKTDSIWVRLTEGVKLQCYLQRGRSWLSKAWPSLWVCQCPSCWLLNHPCLYYFILYPCTPEVISSCGSLSHQGLWVEVTWCHLRTVLTWREPFPCFSWNQRDPPKCGTWLVKGLFLNANHKCMHSL